MSIHAFELGIPFEKGERRNPVQQTGAEKKIGILFHRAKKVKTKWSHAGYLFGPPNLFSHKRRKHIFKHSLKSLRRTGEQEIRARTK